MVLGKRPDGRSREYKQCPCCLGWLHHYQYHAIRGADGGDPASRDFSKCIACKRELCGLKVCKLGTLH